MPEQDGLMRIFWPLDIPRSDSPGIIVGWRNSGLDVLVVAILEDVDVSSGSTACGRLADTHRRAAWKVP
jgi:phosphatidylinositol N-acetylglucosaminyltransferase subunit Q